MKTKILMLAVLLGLTTVVIAQPKEKEQGKSFQGPKHEMRMEDRKGGPENGLNLTDAQKEAFKQSRLAMQKQLQPIQNELGEAEAHQKTLVTTEKTDLAAINKNIEKIGALKVEMAKIQTKHHLEMRAQLTDEQRLKFDAFKHRMKEAKGMKGPKGQIGMNRNMRRPMN
jgi:Spy/CpxP family protein refolding chaperone